MATTILANLKAIATLFLYVGAGYVSLYAGYYLSEDLEKFYEMKGADKTIQTFLFGSLALLWAIRLGNTPSIISVSNFISFISPIIQVMTVVSLAIYTFKNNS